MILYLDFVSFYEKISFYKGLNVSIFNFIHFDDIEGKLSVKVHSDLIFFYNKQERNILLLYFAFEEDAWYCSSKFKIIIMKLNLS